MIVPTTTLNNCSPAFACRYALKRSGFPEAHDFIVYFIVEELDVTFNNGIAEIVDCQAIDIVAVV
jgi:hypothetical protein